MPLEDVDSEDEAVMVERHPNNTSNKDSSMKRHWQWLVGLFGACVIALGVFSKQDAGVVTQDVQTKTGFSKPLRRDCGATCRNYKQQHDETFGGTLLDTSKLLERVVAEKNVVINDLKTRYGEAHFEKIFTVDGDTAKRDIFVSAGQQDLSRPRLIRKMQMKLLSVQLAVQEEMQNVDGCNCQNDEKSSTRPSSGFVDYYQRFVWANGGHSASAAHGNFHDESYTAVMEQTARSVFSKVGIELEGRNYAMGGMGSAPELALCNQAVYGMDADIISWDFGMTDGRAYWKSYLYGNRVGVHPNRPAFMEMGVAGRIVTPRIAPLVQLEEAGLTGMYMKYDLWQDELKNAIPDMQTMKTEEMNNVPEYLRHFRCGDKFEEGDPTCGANKFTETECKFKGRVSWHPGWKAHALNGNLMALFMIDILIEALKSLDSQPDPKTMLETLKRQEDEDYERFFNANITIHEDFVNANLTKEVDATAFFRNPIICHTAILPSETRYLGILTDTQRTSSFEKYELGINKSVASRNGPNTGTWPITYDENERRECDRLELVDYKDWFYVRHGDGDSSLVIPNTAERSVYLSGKTELQGLVVICFVSCPWGKCRPGYMAANEINSGNVTMAVNGETVIQAESIGGCSLLRGEHGHYWESNKDGQYRLTAELKEPNSFMEISSVILL